MTGFKSFQAKTSLELEAGITAVVGPNGSGKSNLADAIRWVLGEQNKSRLRLADREAIIFAGSGLKAQASFAEVSLTFDNADGLLPVDLAEVEIARKLYRSGESTYLLAGKVAKLTEITALLLHVGISPTSYTVIGQGMIDGFLISSPAERKLLFDEAAGIRGPELGRQSAQRKLADTAINITRLEDIASELKERLTSLERVVGTLAEQHTLATHIETLKLSIVGARLYQAEREFVEAQMGIQHADVEIVRLDHARSTALAHLEGIREAQVQARQQQSSDEAHIHAAEATLEELQAQLLERGTVLAHARLQDEAASLRQASITSIAVRLSAATARRQELEASLAENVAAAEHASAALAKAGKSVTLAQASLVDLRTDQSGGSRDQYLSHALEILKVLASGLSDSNISDENVKLLVHKAGRLLSHASKQDAAALMSQLQAAQAALESAMTKRDTATEHQTNITITRRSIQIDLEYQSDEINRLKHEHDELASAGLDLAHDTAAIEREIRSLKGNIGQEQSSVRATRERLAGNISQQFDAKAEVQAALAVERIAAEHDQVAASVQQFKHQLENATLSRDAASALANSWALAGEQLAAAEVTARNGESSTDLGALGIELAAAQARLTTLSTAHADQQAEYDAVSLRHADIAAQLKDLTTAQADLMQVIARLDELIHERFRENFGLLSEKFAVYFAKLFDGGSAKLTLVSQSEDGYGIDIKASAAGKRLSSLTAMSGGERALTGVALLAAILAVNPSPFVVLDEIDAALDEANSGRLAGIITELSQQSQIIVITHNRQTMQAARVLFGVTLNHQQASTVLSLRLEQATALAAR